VEIDIYSLARQTWNLIGTSTLTHLPVAGFHTLQEYYLTLGTECAARRYSFMFDTPWQATDGVPGNGGSRW
jgi:hypothetical protein